MTTETLFTYSPTQYSVGGRHRPMAEARMTNWKPFIGEDKTYRARLRHNPPSTNSRHRDASSNPPSQINRIQDRSAMPSAQRSPATATPRRCGHYTDSGRRSEDDR